MARYALGIDGGGSKCDAALMAEDGELVGWGRGGPAHIHYDPPDVISASYVDAITGALAQVQGGELWAVGHLPEGAPREAVLAHNKLIRHIPAAEEDTAFASAQEQWGLVILAGTGSFVHGRTSDGRELHFGGQGPILGDYGSAYAVGLLGLRAAFASHWTEKRRTTLARAIPAALDVADLHAVFDLVYVKGIGRRQIAALARIIDTEAGHGDTVAIRCLHRAADELAEVAAGLIGELRIRDLSFPVIGVGGVARRSQIWWDRVCRRLSDAAPHMRPVVPPVVPAVGAALLGLREMGVDWTADRISHAEKTASHYIPDSD